MIRILKRAKLSAPKPSDVVYFDRNGYDLFKNSALKEVTHTVLPCRMEEYWLHPKVLWKIAKWLPEVFSRRSELNLTKREAITVTYFAAALDSLQSKIVITFTDNSRLFQSLTSLVKTTYFVAIQNGTRWYSSMRDIGSPIHFQCLLSFGTFEPSVLRSIGAKIDLDLPVGSTKIGLIGPKKLQEQPKVYDLCLISQMRKVFVDGPDEEGFVFDYTTICQFLAQVLKEQGLKLVIALAGNEDWEREFFLKQFPPNAAVTLVPNLPGSTTSYEVAAQSRVLLSRNSTLLLEMFGIGAKTLFCNAGHSIYYSFPLDYDFALRNPTYVQFHAKLKELLAMDPEIYQSKYSDLMRRTMWQHPAMSPTEIVRQLIDIKAKETSVERQKQKLEALKTALTCSF